jgi:putative membrane protein
VCPTERKLWRQLHRALTVSQFSKEDIVMRPMTHALAVAAMASLAVLPLGAAQATSRPNQPPPASGRPANPPAQPPGQGGMAHQGHQAGALSAADTKFIHEAAIGGMAEVEMGRLAAEKASSADVKQFGQRMVDDHGKANDELKSLAQQKNVTLPAAVDAPHKATLDRLSKLSGAAFDRAYMREMVSDHDKDVAAFKKQSTSASDADLKAWAAKTLPTLQEHQTMAKQINGKLAPSASSTKK